MKLTDYLKVLLQILPCLPSGERAIGAGHCYCFHLGVPFYSVMNCRECVVARGARPSTLCQRRKPPINAFAWWHARQPAGNVFRSFTFPPPRTTSSGSSA